MKKHIVFKGALSLIFLLLAACAPTIEGAKSLVSGNAKAEYRGSVSEIIDAIEEMAISVQATNYHTPFFVNSKSVNSIVLISKPLSGSAVNSSLNTRGAGIIEITVTIEHRQDYVHLVFSPNPSSDEARVAQERFIEKLDKRFSRYSPS